MTNLQQPPADSVRSVSNEMRAFASLLAIAGSDSDPFDGRALEGLVSMMDGWIGRLDAAAARLRVPAGKGRWFENLEAAISEGEASRSA